LSRIFLSHSSKDNFEAIALSDWLASEGWSDVFLDLDPERGIAAGERWERALHAAANRCEGVIFLVSGNWLASGWCLKEYALARGLNKKLFAALIDPSVTIASLPTELSGVWQIVDLAHGQNLRLFRTQAPGSDDERHVGYSESGLLRLKRGLQKAGLDARFFAWPPEGEPDRAPYRGLKPQEAADVGIFFGRDAPIVEAVDRLRGLRAGASPRLLAILGASGAGKSSFLRAGLLPRLERDDAQFIPIRAVRPERAALTGENGLVNALVAIMPGHSRAELREAAQAGATALRPLLAERVAAVLARRMAGDEADRPPTFVVAVDQAEELFRAEGREESMALLALLADLAAGDDPTVIVIFTIRSDSYDALQNAKELDGVRQVAFSLSPMPRGAYQDVIEGPARRVEESGGKLAIEPALTQRLLIDIEGGTGDALPLLAFTLEQLYLDYRQTGAMRLKDYEKFGGLRGAIDAAVERAFARADGDSRIPRDRAARLALLRSGLIPWLAGVDPDSRTPRRNIARRADIPNEAEPMIDLLVEERLLSVDTRSTLDPQTGEETRESTIEPTHEALLRQWGLLDGWLKEDFGLLTTLEGAKRAARDWDANRRADSWLAHQGQRLTEVQALDARPDLAVQLDATDRAYLAGCRAREDRAFAEAEQRRLEREQEQQRKLADAERLAGAQRRTAQRTRIGLGVALGLLAIAIGLAGAAYIEANYAIAQKAKAVSNESLALTALAATEATKHPVDAAKLALAAWPRDRSDTAPKLDATLNVLGQVVPNLRERVRIPSASTFASFSLDGTRILTATDTSKARVFDAVDGRQIAILEGHEKGVTFAAFSPDDKTIVTTSKDNTARIWDASDGHKIAKFAEHVDVVTSAAFSPDGARVVTASEDNTAQIWDAATGTPIAVFNGHADNVSSAAFSPDGRRVVTASADKTGRIWSAADGRLIAVLKGHEGPVNTAAFSPDGTRVVTASNDATARIWDAADGHEIAVLKGHGGSVNTAAFSPDGTRVVTASDDATARIWDAAGGKEIATLKGHSGRVVSAGFSRDGSWVVTASDDATARIWDAADVQEIASLKGHDGPIYSGVFNTDATRVVTASSDGTTRIWDAAAGRSTRMLVGHGGNVTSAAFSPDSALVVTASDDKTARIWRAADGRAIATLTAHTGQVKSAVFSPDGTRVATASDDKTARIWDAASGAAIAELKGHEDWVASAAFSPDGMRIITASGDKSARLWDADSGAAIAALKGHQKAVNSAAFSSDGTRVVTASDDKTARLWDAASGGARATLAGHNEEVKSAAFSGDGTKIVTASWDKTARLWDAASGREIAKLVSHDGELLSAAFSSDQTRIVTVSEAGAVRIWDAASQREIAALKGHAGMVFSAAFSADGKQVVTGSQDKTARIWDVSAIPKGDILHVACALLPDKTLDVLASRHSLAIEKPICGAGTPGPDPAPLGAGP
jgi:WD40 repeat protein